VSTSAPLVGSRRAVFPWLVLVAVWIFWGSTYLANSDAVETIPPLGLAGARYLVAGLILYAVVGPRHARGANRMTARQWRGVVVVGLLMIVGGSGLVIVGQKHLASGLTALLVATVPIFMVLGNALVTRTWIKPTVAAALIMGTVGVVILVGGPGGGGRVSSMLIVLIAAALWGTGSVYARYADLPASPLVASALEMATAGAILFVLALVSGEQHGFHLHDVSRKSLIGLIYLVTFGSIVAFSAFTYVNATLPSEAVATYAYVNPVVAVTLGSFFNNEPFTVKLVIGGAVIVLSVVLIVRSQLTNVPPEEVPPEAT
jgi:drug/metabolite transporter (DMT)-like permease